MKIAFDAKRATHNGTGLGNYSRFVLNTLSAHNPENEYLLYTPSKGKANLRSKVNEGFNIHYHYPKGLWNNFGVKSIWRSFGVVASVNNENTDIYHGLSNEIPFGIGKSGVKSVVTIHDLIFLRYPEYYKPIDRAIYKFKFKRACQKADRIIAVSEMTKRDIIKFFDIPANKIDVVYQGCDNSFKTLVPESFKATIRKIYGLPDQFILSVGTIEARKNLLLAVKALKESGKSYHLVAIGKATPYMNKVKDYIQEHGMENQVTFLHNVPFAHLPAIYQMASLFVYPSFFEGFGIPIIEALHSRVPVIAATGSCLEEAGGEHSVYVNPMDHTEMAQAINAIMHDAPRRQQMITHGLEHVQKFEEENIAIELQEVYSRVIEKK